MYPKCMFFCVYNLVLYVLIRWCDTLWIFCVYNLVFYVLIWWCNTVYIFACTTLFCMYWFGCVILYVFLRVPPCFVYTDSVVWYCMYFCVYHLVLYVLIRWCDTLWIFCVYNLVFYVLIWWCNTVYIFACTTLFCMYWFGCVILYVFLRVPPCFVYTDSVVWYSMDF